MRNSTLCAPKRQPLSRSLTNSRRVIARPANKFKPNTRFLRNIIKGTDRHNKALLAKEQTEAQARLKDLSDAEEAKRRKYRPSAGEIRGRQLGNITALLSGGGPPAKRKRPAPADDDEKDGGASSEMQRARAVEDKRRADDMAVAAKRARENRGKRRRSVERYSVRRKDQKGDDDDDRHTHKGRNTSSEEDEEAEGDRKRRRRERDRERSRSPRSSPKKHHRHRSPPRDAGRHKSAHESSDRSHRQHSNEKPAKSRRHHDDNDADSDPLEYLIGPQPAPKVVPRGRGALRGSSGMDSRFSPDYDPKSDVQPDDDARDDWDESLEALRDRAKFRQQGGDRLREAGFTEDQIKKWEKGGEKSVDDVQWTKKGEGREWDRGKDIDMDDD